MALKAIYERFLVAPNPLSLSENASLHYIPTLTTYTQPGPIIRHLEGQNKDVVKAKTQKTISAVEGPSSIALELDVTLEFISGGGAYLPKLENFVTDKTATLPLTHIVQFDDDQKISQIRIAWDQASLLKQTEVIGKSGRNWPVVDGKDQIRLIVSSSTNAPVQTMPAPPTSPRGRSNNENGHARNPSPSKKLIKDPYTSLDTYWTQQDDTSQPQLGKRAVVAPRAESFKPAPRDISEIFAAGYDDNLPGSAKKPLPEPVIAPKGGSSQKFGPARIFEDDPANFISPKIYKTNPARYDHFDIGDSEEHDAFQYKSGGRAEQKPAPLTARSNKHISQWDFQDFTTPQKISQKERPDDKVHFSLDGEQSASPDTHNKTSHAQNPRKDTEASFEFKDDGTPVERKILPKPRKDAQTHFEFKDEDTPAPRRIIARTEAAKGLYHNVLDEDNLPLGDISKNAGRRHDFSNHWDMSNDSASKANTAPNGSNHTRTKSRPDTASSWNDYDPSSEQTRKPATSKAFKQGPATTWDSYEEPETLSTKPRQPTTSEAFKKGLQPQWGLGVEENQYQPR